MWQCKYCGRFNSGLNSCDGCGGPPMDVTVSGIRWQMGTGAIPGEWNDHRVDIKASGILTPKFPESVSVRE